MRMLLSDFLALHKETFFEQTIVGLFHQTVATYPNKTAIVLGKARMTYHELDRNSDRLAQYLTQYEQVRPGEVIALCTGRSMAALAIILGIWKAGAAYIAIDPKCPEEHNNACLESADVRICIDFDYFLSAISTCDGCESFRDRSCLDSTALLLFTSGTTDKPKGVQILHSNITASISNFDCLPLRSDDIFASFASLLFIASVYDICVTMALGCTLFVIPMRIRKSIRDIAEFYRANNITVTFLPPHMAMKYMEEDEGSPLRILLVGSEPVRNLRKRPYEIINVYASSEACAIISHYSIHDARASYPIGKLVPALKGYIVDAEGKLVSAGDVGELWIAGPQIFAGYVDLPKVTAAHLMPNPFGEPPPYDRVFKTADMVRMLPDGDMEYICRTDNVYKVRGFRVDATGVEAHMRTYPHIQDACVTCFTDCGGTNILFGYFIAEENINHTALRTFLKGRLPYYAIPTGLVQVDRFPKTRSGKINRHGFSPPPELNDHKKLGIIYH